MQETLAASDDLASYLNAQSVDWAINAHVHANNAEKCCKTLMVQGAKQMNGKYTRSDTVVNGSLGDKNHKLCFLDI